MQSAVSILSSGILTTVWPGHRARLAFLTICTLVLINFKGFSQGGYEIKVRIPALKESSVILGHYFARETTFIPDDTITLDRLGSGTFRGAKPLTGGMYIVFLPSRKFFDVFIGDNQKFTVEADTNDLVNATRFQGSPENELFYQYRKLIAANGKIVAELNERKKTPISESQKDSVDKAIEAKNLEVSGFIESTMNNNTNLFISKWLKSLREPVIPDYPRDSSGNVTDSAFRYNYWHRHYFDNFDLADQRMLYTPFYENKLKQYFENVIPKIPDSINLEIDRYLEKIRHNEEMFRFGLGFCYNHTATLANKVVGMDAVFVRFAEQHYIPNSSWVDPKFINTLKSELAKIKPMLIGNIAPEIRLVEVPTSHFIEAQKDTVIRNSTQIGSLLPMKDIKAKYLVLAFWEVDCGHCQKDMPALYDSVYPILKKKGAAIAAIQLLSSNRAKGQWVDFINEHKMYDWINAVPADLAYKELYNVFSTPSIYLLDENRKILAKQINIKQIEDFIIMEEKKHQRSAGNLN